MARLRDRLQHAWNAFFGRDHPVKVDYGAGSYHRPDRTFILGGSDRSIVTSICNRIAIDVAGVPIQHVRVDINNRYVADIDSSLNDRLTLEANKDQTGRAFIQDLVMTMFDDGCAAAVPVDTSLDPAKSSSYEIYSMRVGKIVQWHPDHVRVRVYNDAIGRREEILLPKKQVAIIENPLYSIMNEPNSTLQRLIRKLNMLDKIDEQSASGKLDLIIQLPYVVKTKTKEDQAEKRRKAIEEQLNGSKYGIAYTDGTEKITQLNRPIENNLLNQIEYLTNQLYGQLGLTPEILNGTADEKAMLNYNNRTVEPILAAIVNEYRRKFLTKTARTQGQSIMFIMDPFKLVPVDNIADIADRFTRNEILSSNEIRGIVGFKPVADERADELRNKNLNENDAQLMGEPVTTENQYGSDGVPESHPQEIQNGSTDVAQPNSPMDIPDYIAGMTVGEFLTLHRQGLL